MLHRALNFPVRDLFYNQLPARIHVRDSDEALLFNGLILKVDAFEV